VKDELKRILRLERRGVLVLHAHSPLEKVACGPLVFIEKADISFVAQHDGRAERLRMPHFVAPDP
jgi:hypothetical protein